MPRKYERKVGGSLLSGDLLSMLGGPSIGMTKMPLESLFDAALGKGAFESFRNTGTKMLLDTVVKGATDGALKGVLGKGRPRGRPRKVGGAEGEVPLFLDKNAKYQEIVHMLDTLLSVADEFYVGQPVNYFDVNFIRGFINKRTPPNELREIYTQYIGPYRSLYQYRNSRQPDNASAFQAHGSGRPRKHKVLKACHHKHQNKCKCPCVEGGAGGPMDFLHALDLPNTSQKLANSALEVLMKRVLAGGSQPYNAPLMLGPRMIGGHWYDYINPAWYFKKTMQKVVEPVLHGTHLDRVINAIPGVNLVSAMTGATKLPGMSAPPPAAAAAAPAAATKPAGGSFLHPFPKRGRPHKVQNVIDMTSAIKPAGAGRKVKVIGDDNILVQDLEGGGRKRSKAKPKDAAYYRERYARRKAAKADMKVKVI